MKKRDKYIAAQDYDKVFKFIYFAFNEIRTRCCCTCRGKYNSSFMKRKKWGKKELTQRERMLITICNCYLIIA
jgi:hypothetical protein